MRRSLVALVLVALIGGTASARPARRKPRAHEVARTHHARGRFESPPDAATLPAMRYGALSPDECEAELQTRQIPHQAETARGVAAPVRLTGPLHGVEFHSGVAETDRPTTPYEIADCRLVLALDDFAEVLAAHDVVGVLHYSVYRPPGGSADDAGDVVLAQHNGALAIDAAQFTKSDGTTLSVLRDFHGRIGAPTCGKGAGPRPATAAGKELRAILCETAARHLFNVILTPDYNRPHRNHFHLEVTAGVRWFLVH